MSADERRWGGPTPESATIGVDGSRASGPSGRVRRLVTRTCVGCRQRASATELIRVVAVGVDTPQVLIPDLRRSAPGRGAHLHPTTACLDLAQRRRAFGRALRVEGPVDAEAVRRLIGTGREASSDTSPQTATT